MLGVTDPNIPYHEMSERAMPWHTTFIGQSMQHNFWLHAIIDRIMTNNPHIQSIIEIGTGGGVLTTVFGLWGIRRSMPVLSIDHFPRYDGKMLEFLRVKCLRTDELGDEAKQAIESHHGGNRTLLFCDGGCKRDEFRYYAPKMPVGSIVCAHDLAHEFCHEIDAFDVPGVKPYHPEWWMEFNVQTAIYERV